MTRTTRVVKCFDWEFPLAAGTSCQITYYAISDQIVTDATPADSRVKIRLVWGDACERHHQPLDASSCSCDLPRRVRAHGRLYFEMDNGAQHVVDGRLFLTVSEDLIGEVKVMRTTILAVPLLVACGGYEDPTPTADGEPSIRVSASNCVTIYGYCESQCILSGAVDCEVQCPQAESERHNDCEGGPPAYVPIDNGLVVTSTDCPGGIAFPTMPVALYRGPGLSVMQREAVEDATEWLADWGEWTAPYALAPLGPPPPSTATYYVLVSRVPQPDRHGSVEYDVSGCDIVRARVILPDLSIPNPMARTVHILAEALGLVHDSHTYSIMDPTAVTEFTVHHRVTDVTAPDRAALLDRILF